MQSAEIVACSTTITLHNLISRQPILTYKPHRGIVNSVNVNHSNRVIASSGQDGRIILVAAQNPSSVMLQKYFTEEKEKSTSVNCSMFSPHSNYLAAGGGDGTVKVWDMKATGTVHHSLKCHSATVTSLGWVRAKSTVGDVVASASVAGDITLHAARTGKLLDTYYSRNKEVITCLRVSEGETYSRLGVSTAAGTVQVWDLSAQQKGSGLLCDFDVSAQSVPCFSLSSFNPVLMVTAGLDEKLVFFDILLKKHVKTVPAQEPLNAVTFHPNGHLLIAGGIYGGLFAYDLRKLEKSKEKMLGHDTCIKHIDYFKDYESKDKGRGGVASHVKSHDSNQSIPSHGSSQSMASNAPTEVIKPSIMTKSDSVKQDIKDIKETKDIKDIKEKKQTIPYTKDVIKTSQTVGKQVQTVKSIGKKAVEGKGVVDSRVVDENKLSTIGQEMTRKNRDELRNVHFSPPKEKGSQVLQVEKRIKNEMYDCFQRFQMEMIRQFQVSQQETKRMLEDALMRENKKDEKIKELEAEVYALKKRSY